MKNSKDLIKKYQNAGPFKPKKDETSDNQKKHNDIMAGMTQREFENLQNGGLPYVGSRLMKSSKDLDRKRLKEMKDDKDANITQRVAYPISLPLVLASAPAALGKAGIEMVPDIINRIKGAYHNGWKGFLNGYEDSDQVQTGLNNTDLLGGAAAYRPIRYYPSDIQTFTRPDGSTWELELGNRTKRLKPKMPKVNKLLHGPLGKVISGVGAVADVLDIYNAYDYPLDDVNTQIKILEHQLNGPKIGPARGYK